MNPKVIRMSELKILHDALHEQGKPVPEVYLCEIKFLMRSILADIKQETAQ